MSVIPTDHGDATAARPLAATASPGEVERRLGLLEPRKFRGTHWLPVDEVSELCSFADSRISLLLAEVDRSQRHIRMLGEQVEMHRHGALPSTSGPKGLDPVAVELTMRAQEEANRTISEASDAGAEIIADARAQAAEIIADAQRQARRIAEASGDGASADETLRRRVRELEDQQAALAAAAGRAEQQLRQWQAYLSAQADRLRDDAATAGAASQQLRTLLGD